MHDRHDIFSVVIATILLHNMMVEVCMGDGELESMDYYITEHPAKDPMVEQSTHNTSADSTEDEDDTPGCCDTDEHNGNENQEDNTHDENFLKMKYKMTQKRWKQLYDPHASLRLQDSVKMLLYSERYEGVTSDAYVAAPDFDPLKF